MPLLYEFECETCEARKEEIVQYDERDKSRLCYCGGPLKRLVSFGAIHGPAYQMQAVTSSGEHVKGQFGKSAKRDRGGRKR